MRYIFKTIMVAGLLMAFAPISWSQQASTALVLQIDGAIGAATVDYVRTGLDRAAEKQAGVVIIQLDTPGGLDQAMREIIRDMIASPVPVILYVSPSGARAASAGTYMLYAAHVAAMAPATNLGAATPVRIGGLPDVGDKPPAADGESDEPQTDAMTSKMVNDAVAYIRGLAQMRGRNADWAEQAVLNASSLSAEEALQQNVIDLIARDLSDLLEQTDGRTVSLNGVERVLQTAELTPEVMAPNWRNKLLSIITNPNITYILILLAIYGLFFEMANPGFVLPGVIGAISLLLALYALQLLPVNYAGLALILLGIMFMIAELFMPSFGALGIGGVIAFIGGSIILFDADGGNVAVSLQVIIPFAVISAALFLITIRTSIRAFRKPVVSGREAMLGSIGEVMEDFSGTGRIFIHGESWQAQTDSDAVMHRGDKVIVTGIEGLILQIAPVKEEQT